MVTRDVITLRRVCDQVCSNRGTLFGAATCGRVVKNNRERPTYVTAERRRDDNGLNFIYVSRSGLNGLDLILVRCRCFNYLYFIRLYVNNRRDRLNLPYARLSIPLNFVGSNGLPTIA